MAQGRLRMAQGHLRMARGRLLMARFQTGSSDCGWPRVVCMRMARGRLRMARGRLRMARGHPRVARGHLWTARGSPFKPSTGGGSSEAGRRRCTIAHQGGSEGRLLEVGCLRIAQPVSVPVVSPRELTC